MYASIEDMFAKHGLKALQLMVGAPTAETFNEPKVEEALQQATDLINGYIGQRYRLDQIKTTPGLLKTMCLDIATYRLADEFGNQLTEEKRNRFKDAERQLKDISKGDLSLGLPENETPAATDGEVFVSSGPRRFSRGSMGGLL